MRRPGPALIRRHDPGPPKQSVAVAGGAQAGLDQVVEELRPTGLGRRLALEMALESDRLMHPLADIEAHGHPIDLFAQPLHHLDGTRRIAGPADLAEIRLQALDNEPLDVYPHERRRAPQHDAEMTHNNPVRARRDAALDGRPPRLPRFGTDQQLEDFRRSCASLRHGDPCAREPGEDRWRGVHRAVELEPQLAKM